ncbi:hypothetical protein FRB99_008789 [Tulasnella sp. 403]|nr:hypothetical protein FRB99_008789 [Tulasnella sp. 403]
MGNTTYESTGDNIQAQLPDGSTIVYNMGDIAWVMTSTALVWLMIPGIGFFYSGLLRRKNAASMLWVSVVVLAVVSIQWFFWGYSLTYSEGAGKYIGNLKHFGLRGVFEQPSVNSDRIPALLFCIFQSMFAAFTPSLAFGAVAERARLGPIIVLTFLWSTLVYDPIACWNWNSRGWSSRMGSLDFAGGTPVHITSGSAALAISLYLGKRRGYGTERLAYKPHNTSYVVVGTVLLWFGWFGFNGGSALGANLRAVRACVVTNLAASSGGLAWMLWDWRIERKWSIVGFCSGAISGLVCITPGAGYVNIPFAVLFGVLGGTLCNWATKIKFFLQYDDCLDIFAAHGIGGIVGNICTGLFAQAAIAAADGRTIIRGGWLDRHWAQLGYQLAGSSAAIGYSFFMTTAIVWLMHFTPGCRLRTDENSEIFGMDETWMGEYAYDYVAVDPELGPRSQAQARSAQ